MLPWAMEEYCFQYPIHIERRLGRSLELDWIS